MISILGVPFDEYSSYLRGCRHGPKAIRAAAALDSTNPCAENEIDVLHHELVSDVGDVDFQTNTDPLECIRNAAADQLNNGNKLVSLGGDHSITYPILKAIHSTHGPLTVVQLDAHPDLYDEFEGNRYSHACPFARACEGGLISRLIQIGIRTMNRHQREQADRFGVQVVSMLNWSADLRLELTGPVYLTVDIDVLDPAYAPGINHYEPGGLSVRDVLRLIQSLEVSPIGADIVELNPDRDRHHQTALVAAKFLKEILASMLRGRSAHA